MAGGVLIFGSYRYSDRRDDRAQVRRISEWRTRREQERS